MKEVALETFDGETHTVEVEIEDPTEVMVQTVAAGLDADPFMVRVMPVEHVAKLYSAVVGEMNE